MLTLIVVSLFVVAISAQRDHRSIGLTRAFLEDGKPGVMIYKGLTLNFY